jgi:hypothetical protein
LQLLDVLRYWINRKGGGQAVAILEMNGLHIIGRRTSRAKTFLKTYLFYFKDLTFSACRSGM